jgi:hypothetical protein
MFSRVRGKCAVGVDGMPLGGSFGGRVAVGLTMLWCYLGPAHNSTSSMMCAITALHPLLACFRILWPTSLKAVGTFHLR